MSCSETLDAMVPYTLHQNLRLCSTKCVCHESCNASNTAQRRWCSGNINAFQAFALGSIPGRRIIFWVLPFAFCLLVAVLEILWYRLHVCRTYTLALYVSNTSFCFILVHCLGTNLSLTFYFYLFTFGATPPFSLTFLLPHQRL